ncbi:hypothetical protein KXX16_001326 [Aspergillus fumigatus]|nr:hypothetical protein KXX45_009203 [Aspergillus fumigatus]KAH1282213.1 hypothetical protein KXX48_003289 [Aspergillus fumigatus]KAH1296839.1 hypothetical protein KXX11_007660 [Aspergillus fumigatus]KAH1327678.1 hypothetical protein KXX38_004733 [Aspergillus fumigatus]KAH1337737.1 hypothetical protein KXX67_001290 [Aspergillus fumigatus]
MSRSTISLEFPSPPSGFVDQQESSGGTVELPGGSIRVYRCDQDLINAYYIFIHPYFPCLPPPAASQYEDTHEVLSIRPIDANPSILPYWPASSLGLAIAAILVLIPPLSGKPHDATQGDDDNTVKLRRSYADLFARSALESLEESLVPPFNVNSANHSLQSTLHPEIPQKMEPVLALELLSLYECCHRMNVSKMRLRANQALTVAMDLSLHTQDQWTGCLDAQRRCWWATIFLVYLSSIMSSAVPIITFDDSRITTVFPEFRGCREPWPLLVNAEVVLLRSCQIGRQLIRENSNNESIPRPDQGLPHSIGEEIRALDALILELAAEADRFLCVTNYQGPEADASRNLWAISNALIHTARITLHRTRAFLDPPVLLDQHCDVLATETSSSYSSSSSTTTSSQPTTQRRQLSTPRAAEISSFFPFTEEQSVRICLHSALVVSRVFRRLPSPDPTYSDMGHADVVVVGRPQASCWRPKLASPRSIPYMACFQLQSFYILAMVLWRIRTAMCSGNISSCAYLLDRPCAATEVQDAERLVEELRYGMEALERSIAADVVFEGIRMIHKEAERVYETVLMD